MTGPTMSNRLAKIMNKNNVVQKIKEICKYLGGFANRLISFTKAQIKFIFKRRISNDSIKSRKETDPVKQFEQINKQLITMMAKELYSISFVQGAEFKDLLKILNPQYVLPNEAKLLTRYISRYFNHVRNNVYSEINQATAVSLAIDQWKSTNDDVNYVTITAHFINDRTKLKFYLLDCFPCHCWSNMFMELRRVVAAWNLDDKICAVVTGDQHDIIAAVLRRPWGYIKCAAEKINYVMNKFKTANEPVRIKVKLLCEAANVIRPELNLTSDATSKWNTTYKMFNDYLESRCKMESIVPKLSKCENDEIQEATVILKIFKEIIEEMSQDKVASLSKILVLIESSKCIIDRMANDTIKLELNSTFLDIPYNDLCAEAVLLDPRFKKHAFKRCPDSFKSIIQKAAYNATDVQLKGNAVMKSTKTIDSGSSKTLIWSEFESELYSAEAIDEGFRAASLEMDKYLMEPYLDRTHDPLAWWKSRQQVYPRLYQLMLRRLCIPAIAVSASFNFTESGRILAERRAHLSGDELQKLMFLNCNLK